MHLLVFSPYYPPHRGGLESHSDEFNKYCSLSGVTITVFTPRLPLESPAHEERYNQVAIIRFPAIEIIHNYPIPRFWKKEFWQLWKEVHQKRYDLVISRTRFFFTSLMAGYFAKCHQLPWVHIEHGSDFATFNNRFKTLLGKLYDCIFGAIVLRRSDTNIANSQASSAFVKKLSGRDCAVIYRGIEKEVIAAIPTHQYFQQYFPGKIVIGFIGRLIDGKGVLDLLQAFSRLASPTSICCIIGDGPERPRIEDFIQEHNLSKKVILFGEKPFTETIALLKGFDIFVNPSYTEGIPTSVIEAALCHRAIIATDVGGTREIVSGNEDGVLIAPHDIETLQTKLAFLIENSDLRTEYGEKAFQTVQGRFSWKESIKQYMKVFSSLK